MQSEKFKKIMMANSFMPERITQRNALESPLLRLLAELRNQIYEHAFTGGVAFVLPQGFRFKGNLRVRYSKNAFGLRFACRQLHVETTNAFYTNYTFDLTGFVNGHDATREITWKESQLIQSIKLGEEEILDLIDRVGFDGMRTEIKGFLYARHSLPGVRRVEFDASGRVEIDFHMKDEPAR